MAGNRNSGVKTAGPLYICHGAEHEFTIKAEVDSPWVNQGVSLNSNPAEPALPVTTTPAIASFQTFDEQGVTWTIDCPTQPANAQVKLFQLWTQTEFTSPAYNVDVSLGHHRLEFVEASGNEQFQVIEFGEETTLEAREISYYTKEAMPFAAKWKLGEQDLQAAEPDASGWVTPYNFKPSKDGLHLINVTVPSLYYEQGYFRKELPVHALAVTPWGNDAVLQVNNKTEPDVLDRGVVCTQGAGMTVKLLNENLLLKQSTISLRSADADALGVRFSPDLDTERPMEGAELEWVLAIAGGDKSGLFKLQLHCSKLKRDWEITGHVLSKELKDEVEKIEVNGAQISDFGAVFFRKETRPVTVTFAESMRGLYVSLDETGSPGMTYNPPLKEPRKVPDNLKLEWQVTGGDRSSAFALQVVCADVATPLTIASRVMSKITTDEIQSLKINGETVDLTRPELLFFRAGTYTVELIPKPESSLIGLDVALKKGGGAELGMTYDPPLETANPLTQAGLKWTITGGRTLSGLFELLIDVPQVEQSMPVTCRLFSSNLADEVEVKIGGESVPPGGSVFFRGQAKDVELVPKPGSPIAGYPIALARTATSPLLPTDLSSAPAFDAPQTTHKWRVTGANNKSGIFQLQLTAQGMTTPINVTANKLLSSNLSDEATVFVDGASMPSDGTAFFGGRPKELSLEYKNGGYLSGTPLRLLMVPKTGLGPDDVSSNPPFIEDVMVHKWTVTGAEGKWGTFDLVASFNNGKAELRTPTLQLLGNIATELELRFNDRPFSLGQRLFPTKGDFSTLALKLKPNSLIKDAVIAAVWGSHPPGSVWITPDIKVPQPLDSITGASWRMYCGNMPADTGTFSMLLKFIEPELPDLELLFLLDPVN